MVIMIQRSTRGSHAGQYAFPGGRPELCDRDLTATALREAHEEVGIDPTTVTVIGALPPVETRITNFAISAFVGFLPVRPTLVAQADEVDAILEVPLATFLAPGLPITDEWDLPLPGEPWTAPPADIPDAPTRRPITYYPWGDIRIWGATARMIDYLTAAIRSGHIALPTHG